MNILLTPIEKYTLGFETELTHSNIRNIGTSAKFSITDRNAFKGAPLKAFRSVIENFAEVPIFLMLECVNSVSKPKVYFSIGVKRIFIFN